MDRNAAPPADARHQDEAADIARANQLRYVNDEMPGIRRSRHGKGFAYHDAQGQQIGRAHV